MNIWILILVKRGFIQEPEIFFTADDAENAKRIFLNNFNPDYDEIEIFHKRINLQIKNELQEETIV